MATIQRDDKKVIENQDQDNFLQRLGPGLITGASDDDPSGIGTYSQAGAQLGFGVGWTMLVTYPLMAAIQEISGRIGRVIGHCVAGNVCRNYPVPVIWSLILPLFAANTINIAADLGAMGDALKLLIGGPGPLYIVVFGSVSVIAQIFFKYQRYVAILKWLTLVLFAYVITLVVAKVPWSEALAGLLIPKVQWNAAFLTTLVAILGTTISPYLFVWQSSQEAEEQLIDPDKKPLKHEPEKAEQETMSFGARFAPLSAPGLTNPLDSRQKVDQLWGQCWKPMGGSNGGWRVTEKGRAILAIMNGSTAVRVGDAWRILRNRATNCGRSPTSCLGTPRSNQPPTATPSRLRTGPRQDLLIERLPDCFSPLPRRRRSTPQRQTARPIVGRAVRAKAYT